MTRKGPAGTPRKRTARDLEEPRVGEPFGPEVSVYRQSVARWLRSAMRGLSGADKTRVKDVAHDAGISRVTVWRILNGKADADAETLQRLASALKVSVPHVEMVLVTDPARRMPMPPLAKLREAEALIREVMVELTAPPTPTPAAARDGHRALEAHQATHRHRRPA